jgi:hypothetical protein
VLQSDSLKLGLCKFNFIINIINITLKSGVAPKPKILGYNFAEKPKIFKFLFFLIFFMQKKMTRGITRVSKLVINDKMNADNTKLINNNNNNNNNNNKTGSSQVG